MSESTNSFGSSTLKSTGPSMSLIEGSKASVGLGNYKGVMLCNRPFGGTTAPTKPTLADGERSFSCGTVSDPVGSNVPITSFEKYKFKRSKKDSVLSKHKKWLVDLQKTKEQMESEYLEELQKKERMKMTFADNEKKMRVAVKHIISETSSNPESSSPVVVMTSLPSDSLSGLDPAVAAALERARREAQLQPLPLPLPQSQSQFKPSSTSSVPTLPPIHPNPSSSTQNSNKSSTLHPPRPPSSSSQQPLLPVSQRPAWARIDPESSNNNQNNNSGTGDDNLPDLSSLGLQDESDEDLALLNFASSLDYGQTVNQIEIQALEEKLQARIQALEKEILMDEKREVDVEERKQKRELLAMMGETASSLKGIRARATIGGGGGGGGLSADSKGDGGGGGGGTDYMGVAKALLEGEGETLQQIHSAKSVSAIAKNTSSSSSSKALSKEPIIVTHQNGEGVRLELKHSINNLPYMHRNPAV